jgi:DeoR/GlpR family transcriptional regulator of sugar metabolism
LHDNKEALMSTKALILEILQTRGFQTVKDIADELGVDDSTVRRNLEKLSELDLIKRTHGGANAVQVAETPADLKSKIHSNEKKAIGKAMAERIRDGQVVALDSGSTTLEVAKALTNQILTVVTNDLRIGLVIAKKPGMNLLFIGGELLPDLYTMWGPTAVEQIEKLRVDIAVFGADAVNANGVFNNTSYELETKRAMMSVAVESYFVTDSSKFHRKALFKVFDLESFEMGITDDVLNPMTAAALSLPIIRVGPTGP